MSTTKPVTLALSDSYVCVETSSPLANGVIVPYGTPACYDTGAGKVKPATQALLAGGALFLGIALDTWDNSDNRFSTTGPRQLYARNTQWQAPNNVGAPGLTVVGQSAAISDNDSVTLGSGGDVLFRCDALPAEGGAVIWIP